MANFFDVMLQVCAQRVERSTGKMCESGSARAELHRVFKTLDLDPRYKYKIEDNYKRNAEYRICREYAIAIAIGLQFPTVDELNDFLSKAGYQLSEIHQCDVIIRDLIASSQGKCTLSKVNGALEEAKFKPLIVPR